MPAPSASDLRRNQFQDQTQGLGNHSFLAKFFDGKTAKREMARATSLETSNANRNAPANPKQPSPNRSAPANPKQPSPNRSAPANPKQPSPTRVNTFPARNKSMGNPRRAAGPRSAPNDSISGHGISSHSNPNSNPPENRMATKLASETAGPRPFPKSPLTSLLKKNQVKGNEVNRILVTVNVLGSAGPLRFLASCDDPVHKVIETALKSYAREGRLPVLGQNIKQFELYCANSGCGEALDPSEIIGALGTRNFLLCKKHQSKLQEEEEKLSSASHHHHQKSNIWKTWLSTMSSGFGISSHTNRLHV